MEPRISIITLGVSDLNKSRDFYHHGLGLPLKKDEQDIAFFLTKGTVLALYPKEKLAEDAQVSGEGYGFQGFTLAHNVRNKEEVRKVIDQARQAGAVVTKEAQDVFWGGYSGYFKDPDGYLWEVAYNPYFEIE